MPTATPNEEIYLLNVTTTNQPSVFRTNETNRTWLTKTLQYTDSKIYLNDVSRVTSSVVLNAVCPTAASDGIIMLDYQLIKMQYATLIFTMTLLSRIRSR